MKSLFAINVAPLELRLIVVLPTIDAFDVIDASEVKFPENAFALGQIEILNELPKEPAYLAAKSPNVPSPFK